MWSTLHQSPTAPSADDRSTGRLGLGIMEAVRFFWMLSADDAVLLGLSSPDLHRMWSGLNEGYEGGVCILGWRRADGRGVQIFWGLFISVGNIGCCANLLWWRECWTSKLLIYWSIHSSPYLWSTGEHSLQTESWCLAACFRTVDSSGLQAHFLPWLGSCMQMRPDSPGIHLSDAKPIQDVPSGAPQPLWWL